MKPILFAILFLLLPKFVFSQNTINNTIDFSENDKLIYLDSTQLQTRSKDFKYFRIVKDYKLDKDIYIVQEYYKSGIMKMEGKSKKKDVVSKEGEFIFYYDNGNKKSITNYINGYASGKDVEWYENGTKKLEGENIVIDKKGYAQLKINQFWDINGVQKVVDGNGFFEDNEDNESSKGEIKNGFKESVWESYSKKANWTYKEIYKEGKFISGESWGENKIINNYTELEIRPEPKGGMENFYYFIAKNYRTPSVQGLKGKVFVKFVIEKDGRIVDPKVLRDIGYGTGEEALRVLKNCENWIPGEQRGRKVRCTFSVPIAINSN